MIEDDSNNHGNKNIMELAFKFYKYLIYYSIKFFFYLKCKFFHYYFLKAQRHFVFHLIFSCA